jgi:hypothetical protein
MKTKLSSLLVVVALALGVVGTASAEPTTAGTWVLYPDQGTVYTTAVQQPINANGTSNFKSNGNAVIPVKFSLLAAPGPVNLQSILSDSMTDNDYSFLSFTPSSPLLFQDITNLKADYSFTTGNCHLGALRWSVRVSPSQSVFIYYGAYPNFTDCTGANSQSGVNMISLSDLRFDTSQVGGTFYDDYTGALSLVGNMPIVRASLVLDGGGGGDQVLTLTSATVNDNTWLPASGPPTATCDLPPATIQVTKLIGSPSGAVNEPLSIQPFDDDLNFRVVDCKYMYNLATGSLYEVGRYQVEAVISGVPVATAALFDLR